MRTAEKYQEMGFTELSNKKVQDKYGQTYYPKKVRSPLRAIRLMCRECMGSDRRKRAKYENHDLIRACTDPMCPLFDFRLGKNPFLSESMTEKQKKAAVERLERGRGTLERRGAEKM